MTAHDEAMIKSLARKATAEFENLLREAAQTRYSGKISVEFGLQHGSVRAVRALYERYLSMT